MLALREKMKDSLSLIQVRNVSKHFSIRGGGKVVALDNVSFDINRKETFGLVGPSPSGKSTLGRIILNMLNLTYGEVIFDGQVISRLSQGKMRPFRSQMQMVFQNPLSSLNPRRTVGSNLELPMLNFGPNKPRQRRERVAELLHLVGLEPKHAERYPHEFSGGQCQRIGIARALMTEPKFIFLDEPVSALDVSIQAQILNLLKELQEKLSLTYLFVANNLNVVQFISDRVAVLNAGRVVEMASTIELFRSPKDPYTKKLLSAIISLHGRRSEAGANL